MKMNYFVIGIFALSLVACSIDDKLKSADGVNVIVMESTDQPKVMIGDTLWFKFAASSNHSPLKRVEIVEQSFEGGNAAAHARFSLVDTTLDLTLDTGGYFSRPVHSVLIQYPVALPLQHDLVGTEPRMSLRISNEAGESNVVTSSFKVSNVKLENFSGPLVQNTGFAAKKKKQYLQKELKENGTYQFIDFYCTAKRDGNASVATLWSPAESADLIQFLKIWLRDDFRQDSLKTTRFVVTDMAFKDFANVSDE